MADIATHFPPQTYSSSFFLNSLTDDDKSTAGNAKKDNDQKADNAPFLDCFISTMCHLQCCLLLPLLLVPVVVTLECTIPPDSQTRTFPSLLSYQGNKIPFSIILPLYQGCYVDFNLTAITNLPRNTFITYDSEHIVKLSLSGKQIKTVDEGAFMSLRCLQTLKLDHNSISRLSKNVFQDMTNLQELDLSNNEITSLPDMVLSHLQNLKELDLSRNKIRTVQSLAFAHLASLSQLNLQENQIRFIAPDTFGPLVNLVVLNLARNLLWEVVPQQWTSLARLEELDLSGNQLTSFDPNYNFSFYGLKSLNLSSNQLVQLNVFALRRHLGKLQVIDLNDNPWYCEDLITINHHLADSRINYPGRNLSTMNDNGVACSDSFQTHPRKHPEFTTPPSLSSIPTDSLTEKSKENDNDTLLEVAKKLEDSSRQMLKHIRDIESVVIFMLVIISLFAVIKLVKVVTRWSDYCVRHVSYNHGLNPDLNNGGMEHFRLIRR